MRKFISHTVFTPIGNDWFPDKVLAVLFHRSAATLYLLYALWGVASLFRYAPYIMAGKGDLGLSLIASLVIPIMLAAFIGALYFPIFARLEMYSSASFVTLLLLYAVFLLVGYFQGDTHNGIEIILTLSRLVIPSARIVFIYVTLIKQAEGTQ